MVGLLLVLGSWLSGEAQARERARDLLRVGAPEAEEAARMRAVLIGISDFKNLDDDEDLHYAEADAEALARVLQERSGGALADEDLHLLLGRKATYGAVRRALEQELAEAGPDDIVVIFVSSHGVLDRGEGYLLTWDTEKGARLPFTSLPTRDLDLLLQRSRARHVLLLTDACHAAISGSSGFKAGPANGINGVLASSAERAPSLFFQSSSLILQESREGMEYCGGHGVYTCALMGALEGKADRNQDGGVTLSELAVTVPLLVMDATDGEQQPETKGRYDGGLVVALPKVDEEVPVEKNPVDKAPDDLAQVEETSELVNAAAEGEAPQESSAEGPGAPPEGPSFRVVPLGRHKEAILAFAESKRTRRSLLAMRTFMVTGGGLTGAGAAGWVAVGGAQLLSVEYSSILPPGTVLGVLAPLPGNALLFAGGLGEVIILRRQGVHAPYWPTAVGVGVAAAGCSILLAEFATPADDEQEWLLPVCAVGLYGGPSVASIIQSDLNARALYHELGWPTGPAAKAHAPNLSLGLLPTSKGPVLSLQGRF